MPRPRPSQAPEGAASTDGIGSTIGGRPDAGSRNGPPEDLPEDVPEDLPEERPDDLAGPPSGGSGGSGGPPTPDAIVAWLEDDVLDGTVSLPDDYSAPLERSASDLAEAVAADGDELAPEISNHIRRNAIGDLEKLADSQDGGAIELSGDAAADADLALHKVDEILEFYGDYVTDEVAADVTTASDMVAAVLEDGVIDTDEGADLSAAAEMLQGILDDDGTVMSDAGMTWMSEKLDQVDTLLETGSLTLTAEQLAVAEQAHDDLVNFQPGSDDPWTIHEAVDALRFGIDADILNLAHAHDGAVDADVLIM